MFCIRCGTELPDDSRFCSKCGISIVNNSTQKNEPPRVEQKYKKEYIGNSDKKDEQINFNHDNNKSNSYNSEKPFKDYDPTYGCGYESNGKFSRRNLWKGQKVKREFSWQVILESIFTFIIPFIGSVILYKVNAIFGKIFPSQNGGISAVTIICIILLFIICWILWAIGKYIGKRLSNETGLVLGIILILLGVTLYIGIPIIIYSRGAKQIELV